jgi:hypothetical protein
VLGNDAFVYAQCRATLIKELVEDLTGCSVNFSVPQQFEMDDDWAEDIADD